MDVTTAKRTDTVECRGYRLRPETGVSAERSRQAHRQPPPCRIGRVLRGGCGGRLAVEITYENDRSRSEKEVSNGDGARNSEAVTTGAAPGSCLRREPRAGLTANDDPGTRR